MPLKPVAGGGDAALAALQPNIDNAMRRLSPEMCSMAYQVRICVWACLFAVLIF